MKNFLYLFTFLTLVFFLSSCGTRRHPITSNSRAAKAADAMAKIDSKPLYKFINEWAGVKYRLGGLDKRGVDCSGFALLLQKEIYGNQLPRRSRDQATVIRKKSPANLKEGDLVFFSFGGREIDHVGIYLNSGYFVHASTTRGVIVDDLNLPAYQNAFLIGGDIKD